MATLVNNFKHASGQSLMGIAKEKIQHVFNAYINSLSKDRVRGAVAPSAHRTVRTGPYTAPHVK